MSVATLAALIFLAAAAAALWVGEQALLDARDLTAAYWLVTGAVSVRASLVLSEKQRS